MLAHALLGCERRHVLVALQLTGEACRAADCQIVRSAMFCKKILSIMYVHVGENTPLVIVLLCLHTICELILMLPPYINFVANGQCNLWLYTVYFLSLADAIATLNLRQEWLQKSSSTQSLPPSLPGSPPKPHARPGPWTARSLGGVHQQGIHFVCMCVHVHQNTIKKGFV